MSELLTVKLTVSASLASIFAAFVSFVLYDLVQLDFSRYSKSNILVTEMLCSTPKHWGQLVSISEQIYRSKYRKSLKSLIKQAYCLHFWYRQLLPPKDPSEVPKGHLRKSFYRLWGIVHLSEAS